MRCTYHIEAIRSQANDRRPQVLDRMIVRAADLESVKRQAILLFQTARAPQWTRQTPMRCESWTRPEWSAFAASEPPHLRSDAERRSAFAR